MSDIAQMLLPWGGLGMVGKARKATTPAKTALEMLAKQDSVWDVTDRRVLAS